MKQHQTPTMSKTIILMICLLPVCFCHSQVLIQPVLPPAGLTLKSQLWNISLVNISANPVEVSIEMTMVNVVNSQTVLTGKSKRITVNRGAKQLQPFELAPVAYTVGAGFNIGPGPDAFLPIGIYRICYTVLVFDNDAYERLDPECETLEIEPLGPPELVNPRDSEHVEIDRPAFLWMPPSPYNLFTNLTYDWVLVEVQSIQSAGNAIQQNIPLLTMQNVPYNNLQYPLSAPALDSSKLYAWRVVAKDNKVAVATSETWTFKLKILGYDSTLVKGSHAYIKLKREENAAVFLCNGVLRFEYLNELNDNVIRYRLFDIGVKKRKEIKLESDTIRVSFGQNFINLDLTETTKMHDRHLYLFEILNYKDERWFMKFEFRKPK